jgi:glycosyltransferase involved in cell wall biosynthesis
MAVHNGGELLRETIESVLAQTYRDFEFIIVDDGSSDGSVDIVKAYEDPRIRLLQPGRLASQSKCLNLGVDAARGDWIARIDADDPAHPQRLEVMVAAAEQADGYGVIASDMQVVFGDAQPAWEPVSLPTPALVNLTGRLGYHNPVLHSSVLIRRSAFEQVGGFEPALDLVNDYWLWGKIAKAGWKVGRVPLVLQAKRVHAGQHFENKQRLKYLFATTKPQRWIGQEVLGWPRWKADAVAAARIVYGLLPQRLRASLFKSRS